MAASASISTGIFRAVFLAVAAGLVLTMPAALHAQQPGTLDTIRSDVRQGPPPAQPSAQPQSASSSSASSQASDAASDILGDDLEGWLAGAAVVGGALTSPIWAPHVLLDDDYSVPQYFPRFPYDDTSGYLVEQGTPIPSRTYAVRVDADYVEAFDHLDLINGHILVSTTSRFEFDARVQHLGENEAAGQADSLWIGDCNVMYRYAQSSFAQFRAGVGLNWLNDPGQTDLGVNFAYGIDVFPVKPLVFSTVIDAGTLGHAGLFRFRATAGLVYQSIELYTGYEYTDIGQTHWNGLIGGVRLWF